MSIWSSQLYIGHYGDDYDGDLPLTYQGSHVYPDFGEHAPASVDTAAIPHHCIPGHHDGCHDADGDASGVAPWLRLAIDDPAGSLTVVLPAAAVEALRDEMTDWLGRVWREGSET